MELEIENVEKALWMITGVGPLPKLTLLEAESDSLVHLRWCTCFFFSFCSFCNGVKEKRKKRKSIYQINELLVILWTEWVSRQLVDLPAVEYGNPNSKLQRTVDSELTRWMSVQARTEQGRQSTPCLIRLFA